MVTEVTRARGYEEARPGPVRERADAGCEQYARVSYISIRVYTYFSRGVRLFRVFSRLPTVFDHRRKIMGK